MFQIGDRVKCIVDHPDGNQNIFVGSTGTVCYSDGDSRICVRWDAHIDGHDCCGRCEYGYGWNVDSDDVVLCQERDTESYEFDEQLFKELIFG